jgi:hypothetical protein
MTFPGAVCCSAAETASFAGPTLGGALGTVVVGRFGVIFNGAVIGILPVPPPALTAAAAATAGGLAGNLSVENEIGTGPLAPPKSCLTRPYIVPFRSSIAWWIVWIAEFGCAPPGGAAPGVSRPYIGPADTRGAFGAFGCGRNGLAPPNACSSEGRLNSPWGCCCCRAVSGDGTGCFSG